MFRPISSGYGVAAAYRLYHPARRRHHRTPDQFGLDYQEATTTTDDGVRLHLWHLPAAGDQVAVVGHGIGLTKSASIAQAKLLHDQGFDVVMFDHRNHARSGRDGAVRQLSDRFSRDVEATVRFAQQLKPGALTLVWGFSFSSFPSFFILGRDNCRVDAVLCDSGPADELEPLFTGFATAGALPIPAPLRGPGARAAVVATCARVGIRMLGATWPPPSEGRFATTPMLFLSGKEDQIVRPELVQALSNRYPLARTELVEGAHLDGIKVDPDGYRDRVTAFLQSL
jgi:pimeloyl-ACP methyl ester carboxylesterase